MKVISKLLNEIISKHALMLRLFADNCNCSVKLGKRQKEKCKNAEIMKGYKGWVQKNA